MLGEPSDQSAVIVRVRLPDELEGLRRRSVADAAAGVPAHITLLYPFVAPERLEAFVRRRLTAVAHGTDALDIVLDGPRRWPGAIYAGILPPEPLVRLQGELAASFPDHPIYGGL